MEDVIGGSQQIKLFFWKILHVLEWKNSEAGRHWWKTDSLGYVQVLNSYLGSAVPSDLRPLLEFHSQFFFTFSSSREQYGKVMNSQLAQI